MAHNSTNSLESQLWKTADKLSKNIDAAIDAIERDNPSLRSVLPKLMSGEVQVQS